MCACVCVHSNRWRLAVHKKYSFSLLKKYIRCSLNKFSFFVIQTRLDQDFFLFISLHFSTVVWIPSCCLLNIINNFYTMVQMLSRNVNTRNCFEPFELFHSIYWFEFPSDSDKGHWKYLNQQNLELYIISFNQIRSHKNCHFSNNYGIIDFKN